MLQAIGGLKIVVHALEFKYKENSLENGRIKPYPTILIGTWKKMFISIVVIAMRVSVFWARWE